VVKSNRLLPRLTGTMSPESRSAPATVPVLAEHCVGRQTSSVSGAAAGGNFRSHSGSWLSLAARHSGEPVLLFLLLFALACGRGASRSNAPDLPDFTGVWYGIADGATASIELPDLTFALELTQAGDSVRGSLGWSCSGERRPVRGTVIGQTLTLDWQDMGLRLDGELDGDHLSGVWAYADGNAWRPGKTWIATRGLPRGSGMAASWSGTAFGRLPYFARPPADYPFYLTTVPFGDSLLGAMDPTTQVSQQVRIHGQITADSICFSVLDIGFRGVVADTVISGFWRWEDPRTGDIAESTWVAHRIVRHTPPRVAAGVSRSRTLGSPTAPETLQ
jgi:hypothetical protein